jgi:hypothetical protein
VRYVGIAAKIVGNWQKKFKVLIYSSLYPSTEDFSDILTFLLKSEPNA